MAIILRTMAHRAGGRSGRMAASGLGSPNGSKLADLLKVATTAAPPTKPVKKKAAAKKAAKKAPKKAAARKK